MQRDTSRDPDGAEVEAEIHSEHSLDSDAGTGAQPSTADATAAAVDVERDVLGDEVDPPGSRAAGESADAPGSNANTDADGGSRLRGLVPSPSLPSLSVPFSPKVFVLALVASVIGLVAGGSIPVLGGVPVLGRLLGFVGLFVVAFGAGLVTRRRRYLEVGAGAAVASAFGFVLDVVSRQLFRALARLIGSGSATEIGTVGLVVTGVGAGTGLLVALAGYYFGRDLRDGLTRDVEGSD